MATRIAHQKIVSALPATLDADTIYFVRVGAGFDQYVTNSSGTVVAYRANAAGTAGQVQYNSGGLTAGAAKTAIDSAGNLLITVDNAPITPSATTQVVTHTRQRAARAALAWTDGYGVSLTAQPSLASNAVWTMSVASSNVAPNFYNIAMTVSGQSLRAIGFNGTSTDHITTRTRVAYQTTAIAGNIVYAYGGQRHFFYNSATAQSYYNTGFRFELEFTRDDATAVTGARMFIGLTIQTAAPTNVEPNTLTRVIGLIKRSTDTNLQIYSANASVTTPIDLGANFPANSLVNVYRLTIHSPKNTGRVFWDVVCINTGAVASGEFAKLNLNDNITSGFFAPYWWISNGSTAAAASLVVFDGYGDSPR
ncbi:MAG: hypothetical protein RLY58_540 [Pseudomonadota bacterium]|jgi:hypothetical protein